jgi:predicted aspartyl protease
MAVLDMAVLWHARNRWRLDSVACRPQGLPMLPGQAMLVPVGLTYVDVEICNPGNDRRELRSLLVESGAVYSVLPASLLADLGIAPARREFFTLANGERVEHDIGEARFSFNGRQATSPVVFGDASDIFLLGAVTLETLGFVLDPFHRELRPLRLMLA